MKYSRMLTAIDSHTCGEAARLIIGGVTKFPVRQWLKRKSTWKSTRTICGKR